MKNICYLLIKYNHQIFVVPFIDNENIMVWFIALIYLVYKVGI